MLWVRLGLVALVGLFAPVLGRRGALQQHKQPLEALGVDRVGLQF